jgi:alpha-glucosidase
MAKGRFKYKKARITAMLLLTLRGTPFLYYGDEIGMKNTRIKRKNIRDYLGIKLWPFYKGRDKGRTPMQWTNEEFAGFSKTKSWLPVNSDYANNNVEKQRGNNDSLLNFYRSLIKIRDKKIALQSGIWNAMNKGEKNIFVYSRTQKKEKLIIILNFSSRNRDYTLDDKNKYKVLISTHRSKGKLIKKPELSIFPFEATLLEEIIGKINF